MSIESADWIFGRDAAAPLFPVSQAPLVGQYGTANIMAGPNAPVSEAGDFANASDLDDLGGDGDFDSGKVKEK